MLNVEPQVDFEDCGQAMHELIVDAVPDLPEHHR